MEHFNGILFQKSGPANKQHTNQPTNQPDPLSTNIVGWSDIDDGTNKQNLILFIGGNATWSF
jgi:hypothetical protein